MKISKVKSLLLGMLVFLLLVGSWFVYRQISRTDVLKSPDFDSWSLKSPHFKVETLINSIH